MLPIVAWVYDDRGWIIGMVVGLPYDCWVYRPLRREDRMLPPVGTSELVETIRPYLVETASINGEEEPDRTNRPGSPA